MEYVLAAMFVVGGTLFIVLGYKNLVATRRRRAEWVAVDATVVDFSEQPGDKGKTLFAPIYRYNLDGIDHTATSKLASRPPDYRVGDPIAILVNPARSDESDVAGGTDVLAYALIGMGLLALAVGLLVGWLAHTGQMTFDTASAEAAGIQPPPDGGLRWEDLEVRARLDADGALHVAERVTLVAFGSVETAERGLRGWVGTSVQVTGARRYELVDNGFTLRWALRGPDDPPFPPDTRLVFPIEYVVTGAVIPAWGVRRFGSGTVIPPFFLDPRRRWDELRQSWRLAPGGWGRRHVVDHDFSPFPVNAGATLDHASVEIALDPAWDAEPPLRREWRPASAGVDLREPRPIEYRGGGAPSGVPRTLHATWLVSLALFPIAALAMGGAAFARRRRTMGQLGEGAAHAGGPFYLGARASLEAMNREGKIVLTGGPGDEALRLRATRDTLAPWDRAIVERLFGSVDTVVLESAERRAREGALDLDAAGSRAFEAARLTGARLGRQGIVTAALVVLGGVLMLAVLRLGGFQALFAGLVFGSLVYRLSRVLRANAALVAAPLFAAAVVLFFLSVPAHPVALLGLAVLWLGLLNSLLHASGPAGAADARGQAGAEVEAQPSGGWPARLTPGDE